MASEGGPQAAIAIPDAAKAEWWRGQNGMIWWQEWVYFIRNPHTGRIKIGFTAVAPEPRLRDLENAAGQEQERLGLIRGGGDLERMLHAQFAASCWRSEWFEDNSRLRAFIAAHATPWTGSEDICFAIEITEGEWVETYFQTLKRIRSWLAANP